MERRFAFPVLLVLTVVFRISAQNADSLRILQDELDFKLLLAAEAGDSAGVVHLTERGADVNASSIDGVTPVMYAASKGYLNIVIHLLDRGADISAQPWNGIGVLMGAVMNGYVFIADTLINRGANVNDSDLLGRTPLMVACADGNWLMADMLLYYGADPSQRDEAGNSALMYASWFGHSEIIPLLLEHGAPIDPQDMDGFTPFMAASQQGHQKAAELLLEAGAEMYHQCNEGMDALKLAINGGHREMTVYLLQQGYLNHPEAGSPREYARLALISGQPAIARILKEHGLPGINRPLIGSFGAGLITSFHSGDFLMGGSFGLQEVRYGTTFQIRYMTRPWVSTRHVPVNDTTTWVVWEKRSRTGLSLAKKFMIHRSYRGNHWGVLAGAGVEYTWGRYRGTGRKPAGEMNLVPAAALFRSWRFITFQMGYEYFRTDNELISPHYLHFALNLDIKQNCKSHARKKITLF